MRRGAKPTKAKVNAKPPVASKSPKNQGSKVRDLEKRLAEALKRESEALERQTATAEILRAIASSPTEYQPVFDTIVRTAGVVCGAVDAMLWTIDGDELVVRAHHGPLAAAIGARQPVLGSVAGYAVRRARIVHVEDLTESDDFPIGRDIARRLGWRTTLSAPLLRDGVAIGAILIRRSEMRPFSEQQIALLQTFADQAVIAIENVRLFTELQEKNRALTAAHVQVTEALEQQTATSDILRVISSSPTDVQPVFDTIAAAATTLCAAENAGVFLFDGTLIHFAAHHHWTAKDLEAIRQVFPRPPGPGTVTARAILTRAVAHTADIAADPGYEIRGFVDEGFRAILSVPMLRDGDPIGAISVTRRKAVPFADKQIALLQTFADQAVIAIQNVRLFKELKASNREVTEALEQQTATAEILRVISQSPTDLQPVLDAIAASAARLCDSVDAQIFRIDGGVLRIGASYGALPKTTPADSRPIDRGSVNGRAVVERRTIHLRDLAAESDTEWPVAKAYQKRFGHRTIVATPLLREGVALGAITIRRMEVRPFSDTQIALLETFADQAVIAIENVRLFKELDARNRDLTEALEQQTATSQILQVISSSPTDVQPTFDAIAASARALCEAAQGMVFRFDGELIHLAAHDNLDPDQQDVIRSVFPIPPGRGSVTARAILTRALVHVRDRREDPELEYSALSANFPNTLSVPLLREGAPLGAITLTRAEVGLFSERQIALLQTFADQAVIAIENVRLFKELQTLTGELTRSVEKLTALGEVSRALSSTLDVDTVLSTIVSRAKQLAGTDACSVYEYDERTEEFVMRATHDLDESVATALRRAPIRRGDGAVGRMAVTREPVQIPDIALEGAYHGAFLDLLLQSGTRALLAMPLLHEDHLVGGLTVNKKTPGEFSPEVIELLKTFAAQSALAIQNARLFREIADKSAQLEAASRHKSEFLANMSHELRTPLNAIIGFSEVLTERMFGELNEKQDEYLKDIYASGQHLLSLINDILDLSKIEAGRMELEATDFDLPSAIDNALILVRERASRRGITLGHSVDERLGSIQGDERKVKQVLLNLLSNALKFTPEGGRIDVCAVPHDGVAEISVADSGVGIAPEDQEAVFEEFRQVGTADKKVEGTGLGLALSRKFIELHGGRIWVESEVGKGSTFTFTLPVRRED